MSTPFAPESAPAAGAEPQAPSGAPEGAQAGADGGQPTAPAGADPRVLEQMQSQMEQFGGTLSQFSEYLPAIQQLAQQQGGGQNEPTLEDQFAAFFDPNFDGGYDQGGNGQLPDGARFDPYTGEPVQSQQQQQRFDPYTGEPLQPQGQQQQAGLNGNPGDLVNLFREVVRQEVMPLQHNEERRQWDSLYEQIPALKDPQQQPQIAKAVADAAYLFGRTEAEAKQFANNPNFVRMAYFASVNEQRGQGETPAGANDGTTPIEAGSSTSAPGGQQVDPGDAIVGAGTGGGGGAGSHFR